MTTAAWHDLTPYQQAQILERRARTEHEHCQARWGRLSPSERSGTTFHDWDAHLPAAGGTA